MEAVWNKINEKKRGTTKIQSLKNPIVLNGLKANNCMLLSNITLPLNSYHYISMKYMCKYRYAFYFNINETGIL